MKTTIEVAIVCTTANFTSFKNCKYIHSSLSVPVGNAVTRDTRRLKFCESTGTSIILAKEKLPRWSTSRELTIVQTSSFE
ncbi:hypothetical protein V1477_010690 [Vespula maculifrons]|uniref:Uncharacterized protein n=1 Tax=Vespula maculifrons TaxID=7453 RepID=A0ABD2C2N7_VESMC